MKDEQLHFSFSCAGNITIKGKKMNELARCPCCKSRLINYDHTGKVLSCTWRYWESGARVMPGSKWELFNLKTRELKK